MARHDDRERLRRLQSLIARILAPRTALEVIRHERAVVLLGDPGSGKTTVLRHLALAFAHARLHANDPDATLDPELVWGGALPLPILVQLRRFAATLIGPPADAGPLLAHIEQVLSGDRLDALARHLLTRLEAGSVLVLLDGLDEVPDDAQRGWVAQAAALFQSRFPRSRVVVTCRVYAYRDMALLPHPFRVTELRPLDTEAQNDFLARWYRAALLHDTTLAADERERVADERARELVQALDRHPRLREIATNPLLLTMIALVHQFRLRLPQQRAELYRECLLLLLEQWEQRRADGAPAGLVAELGVTAQLDHLPLIQPLAYELHVRGAEEASNREAKSWLLERFVELANDDVPRARLLIERFLVFLEGRSGLLIARDIKDRYAFPHRTFQEYLVAREMIYQGTPVATKAVVAHRHDTPWREVVLLVAGHWVAAGQPDQARALGWRLLEADTESSDGFYRSAVLAGEIIEELGGVLGRDGQRLREDVVVALIALVRDGHLTARERVDAALLLGRLGGSYVPVPEQPEYWCQVAAGLFWYGDDREDTLQQVELPYSFQIARYPVTNAEYARFIEAGGYRERQWWTEEGWAFLQPGNHPALPELPG